MSTTILGALRNADYNLRTGQPISIMLGSRQVHNAVILLGKGYDLHGEMDALLEVYGNVESVPPANRSEG